MIQEDNFNWLKYFELAEYMSDNAERFPDSEACYRTSVSRAYYAVLGMVCNYIYSSGGNKDDFKTDTHRKVREHLKKSGDKLKRKIANQLEIFHKSRIQADYHDRLFEKPVNKAKKSIAQAKQIMQELLELSQIG
jgi:uncharacterized protein (UPF0332 family)